MVRLERDEAGHRRDKGDGEGDAGEPQGGSAVVEILFLGTGDAFGSGGRLQTCISVRHDGRRLLLDCGGTVLPAMRRYGVDPLEVDTVVLSHLHGDHFAGLPFLFLEGRLVSMREDPLNIVGPMETGARLRTAMDALFAGSSPENLPYRVRIREYEATRPVISGAFTITAFPALHSPGSNPYAIRIEVGGKVVAYSGDSAWTPGLVQAARGADLFICEAYTWDSPLPNHLDYKTLLHHRDELDCKRIILTHMGGEMLARLGQVEMETADDGMKVTV